MGQYDFTYVFPADFLRRVTQLLQENPSGTIVASAFQRCHYEYEDIGLAYYAGFRGGDIGISTHLILPLKALKMISTY